MGRACLHPRGIGDELSTPQGQRLVAGAKELDDRPPRACASADVSFGAQITMTPPVSCGRIAAIVEIVAIERDQRARQLAGELEMAPIVRAAQVVVLDDEEHVPAEIVTHEVDDAGRHVGVGVDAWRIGKMRVGGELGGERSQGQLLRTKLGSG